MSGEAHIKLHKVNNSIVWPEDQEVPCEEMMEYNCAQLNEEFSEKIGWTTCTDTESTGICVIRSKLRFKLLVSRHTVQS